MNQENKKYALLEDGTVEPLFYENEEPREFYQDEDNGEWYLDHDVYSIVRNEEGSLWKISYKHSKIVKFGNSLEELL